MEVAVQSYTHVLEVPSRNVNEDKEFISKLLFDIQSRAWTNLDEIDINGLILFGVRCTGANNISQHADYIQLTISVSFHFSSRAVFVKSFFGFPCSLCALARSCDMCVSLFVSVGRRCLFSIFCLFFIFGNTNKRDNCLCLPYAMSEWVCASEFLFKIYRFKHRDTHGICTEKTTKSSTARKKGGTTHTNKKKTKENNKSTKRRRKNRTLFLSPRTFLPFCTHKHLIIICIYICDYLCSQNPPKYIESNTKPCQS